MFRSESTRCLQEQRSGSVLARREQDSIQKPEHYLGRPLQQEVILAVSTH